MPQPRTGQARFRGGRWYARVTFNKDKRPSFALTTCGGEDDEEKASARALLLSELATKLRAAGHLDLADGILKKAASRDGAALETVKKLVDAVAAGTLPVDSAKRASASMTFEALGKKWTNGELHKENPDHIKKKSSSTDDEWRLAKHVYPLVGHVPIESFTVEHADAVMRSLPSTLESSTRRHVGQLMGRVLAMAVSPLRLIPVSPIPRGFLPKVSASKAMTYLYPEEDAKLLACADVPLCFRLLYGFLAREGLRAGEAAALTWSDVDRNRGAIALDVNKTDDPRAWALSPGAARALRAWWAICEAGSEVAIEPSDHVFLDTHGHAVNVDRGAERFRAHLKAAGLDRVALFEESAKRRSIRVHDLRATFITIALATGKTESWVADRTGHRSSVMINRYRRQARMAAELGQGDMLPLDEAIPELAPKPSGTGSGPGSSARVAELADAPDLGGAPIGDDDAQREAIAAISPGVLDASTPHVPLQSPSAPLPDPVEAAMADALTRAAAAGEWGVVAQLGRELEARRQGREAGSNVVPIARAKR